MIGLFLGDTDFPEIVLKKIKKLKKKYFIIDFSKNNKFHKDKNSHKISIEKFGKIINLIKNHTGQKNLLFFELSYYFLTYSLYYLFSFDIFLQ